MAFVSFTDHAKIRCKQQGISMSVVTALILSAVPPTVGEFRWYFPDHFSVVIHYYPEIDKYTVITVIGLKKIDWGRRNWKDRKAKGRGR